MAKTETKDIKGIKVSALAKEFRVTSKLLITKCAGLKIKIKNHASILTRGQADRIRAKLGAGELLRAEVEKKTKVTRKKAASKAILKPSFDDPKAIEEVALPESEAVPAPEKTQIAPVEQVDENPTYGVVDVPPVVEAPIPVAKIEKIPEPVPEPVLPPGKVIAAGPDITPPVKRPDGAIDPRFGVVMAAVEAKKVHGEPEAAPKATSGKSDSKKGGDFKAEVSYPSVGSGSEGSGAAGDGKGRTGSGTDFRRGPVRRGPVRGGRRGPRRGRALMNEGERYRKARNRRRPKGLPKPTVVRTGPAEVTAPVTVKVLCEGLGIKSAVLIAKLMSEGRIAKINDILLNEEAELYAAEFDPLGFGITIKKARDVEEDMLAAMDVEDRPEDMEMRAPIITVMGHVDHGKTSLLDCIRKSTVVDGESGGITQHIAAYMVTTNHGPICFLDTPGHSAFTEMRARGANVTDVVVLVVAADDGVMPQTEEAIDHARAAEKKLIVAINKIDLPEANSEKIKGELAAKEVFVEGYGGEVGFQEVSAKDGTGIKELLERIALEAEVLELQVNPNKPGLGTVVEAHKEEGRGIVATLLVQEGTLRQGDALVCGHTFGSVRQLLDDHQRPVASAGPSVPVLITGLNDVPLAGERFHVLKDIKLAAEISQKRASALRQEGLSARTHVTLENLHEMIEHGEITSLNLILKVDVMGSLSPIQQAVMDLSASADGAQIKILHSAVGAINETDIHLADASNAIVIGFHVTADPTARRLAEVRSVEIRTYEVIYEVIDEMRKSLEGMLKPIVEEVIEGHLEVRQTFKISKVGTVAGSFVLDGTISRNSSIRLIRDGKPIWNGKLHSLKRIKEDVREVREGFECGVCLDGYNDVKVDDIVEAYKVTETARTLGDTAVVAKGAS